MCRADSAKETQWPLNSYLQNRRLGVARALTGVTLLVRTYTKINFLKNLLELEGNTRGETKMAA